MMSMLNPRNTQSELNPMNSSVSRRPKGDPAGGESGSQTLAEDEARHDQETELNMCKKKYVLIQ